MNAPQPPDDVARLIYGSVHDLQCMLPHETSIDLIERALAAAGSLRESKTKRQLLTRRLLQLRKTPKA